MSVRLSRDTVRMHPSVPSLRHGRSRSPSHKFPAFRDDRSNSPDLKSKMHAISAEQPKFTQIKLETNCNLIKKRDSTGDHPESSQRALFSLMSLFGGASSRKTDGDLAISRAVQYAPLSPVKSRPDDLAEITLGLASLAASPASTTVPAVLPPPLELARADVPQAPAAAVGHLTAAEWASLHQPDFVNLPPGAVEQLHHAFCQHQVNTSGCAV